MRYRNRFIIILFVSLLWVISATNAIAQSEKLSAESSPDATEADIWILAGQSNLLGAGYLKEPFKPDPRIMVFTKEKKWVQAEEPLHRELASISTITLARPKICLQRDGVEALPQGMTPEKFVNTLERNKTVTRGVGPGRFFAEHLLATVNRPIGLIFAPYGGTYMTNWDPQSTDSQSLYHRMLEQVHEAGGRLKGLLWYQGEAEGWNPENYMVYEQRFLNLIDSVRRDLARPDLPIIYVQVSRIVIKGLPANIAGWELVRETQRRVASLRKNVYMVSAIDLPLDDFIHIAYEGQQRLGRRLAEVALSEVYHQAGHGHPIDIASIEVIQPDLLRIRFSGVSGSLKAAGRLTGFELRPAQAGAKFQTEIYRIDRDPEHPDALILGLSNTLVGEYRLHYAAGLDPYVNIVDEQDIPVPAFGPVKIPFP